MTTSVVRQMPINGRYRVQCATTGVGRDCVKTQSETRCRQRRRHRTRCTRFIWSRSGFGTLQNEPKLSFYSLGRTATVFNQAESGHHGKMLFMESAVM